MKHDPKRLSKWRNAVFNRDGVVCMNKKCDREYFIQVHHIVFRSQSQASKYDPTNGIPLCDKCHYYAHNGLGLRSDVTGRQFVIGILEQYEPDSVWNKVLEILKRKEY